MLDSKDEKLSRSVNGQGHMAGHRLLRPSIQRLYRTSARCLVCSMPGTSRPGRSGCFSDQASLRGDCEDWRRRWLFKCGLFLAKTNFGFCGVLGTDDDIRFDKIESLHLLGQPGSN